ncbi:MAG: GNAT family N-acetyltransferase [Clostridiales bacterium]|nr:GNAT family N-acetyltransferase [Clostridiales bacterium]
MKYVITLLSIQDVKLISKWKYEDEYSIYSMDENQESIGELLDGSYYCMKENDTLIGYFCFGKAAQVSAGNEYNAYNDMEYTDIGLGIKPDLCGRGLGFDFLLNGMEFAKKELSAKKFRLTVADFNKRAIKVYERVGFRVENSFIRKSDDVRFFVMDTDAI